MVNGKLRPLMAEGHATTGTANTRLQNVLEDARQCIDDRVQHTKRTDAVDKIRTRQRLQRVWALVGDGFGMEGSLHALPDGTPGRDLYQSQLAQEPPSSRISPARIRS